MSGSKRRTLAFLLILCLLPAGVFFPAEAAETLNLPANLKAVPAELFRDDQAVSSVVLPDSVTEIGSKAFAGSGLKEITIPAGVTDIGSDAFSHCDLLVATVPADSYAAAYCEANGIIVYSYSE